MNEKEYKKALKNKLIEYRDTLNLGKNVTFGIELELENIEYDAIEYYLSELKEYNPRLKDWKSHRELDISEYKNDNIEMNGEISSAVLTDTKDTWKDLEELLIFFDKKGALITNRCGGHVNIGGHVLGTKLEHIKNFLVLWKVYNDFIYRFSTGEYEKIRSRAHNIAQPIPLSFKEIEKIKSISELNECITSKFFDIWFSDSYSDRIEYENRIEFRIPNGTLREEIWQNYINFFSKLLIASRKKLDREKLIHNYKKRKLNINDFINYIFTDDLDKENFLIQTLKTNDSYKNKLLEHKKY